jgi:hypothetical protein
MNLAEKDLKVFKMNLLFRGLFARTFQPPTKYGVDVILRGAC